jgi:predicted ATPase
VKDGVSEDAIAQADQLVREAFAASKLHARKKGKLPEDARGLGLADFMVYAPENATLRNPPPESAIQPVGTKGEGLFKLLQSFTDTKFSGRLSDLKERLRLFGWFEDFLAPDESATAQARLQIRDRWLAPDRAIFDQRSANEGFLYVLFYLALLMSWRTPRFFALDNVDNALNPKLCSTLMRHIAELATKYDKQVICTTHNPAILDGLNINDDQERLFTVRRDAEGHTVVSRVQPPKPQPGRPPMKLSAAFLAGYIGGLPDHF